MVQKRMILLLVASSVIVFLVNGHAGVLFFVTCALD